MVLFVALLLNATYVQYLQADDLNRERARQQAGPRRGVLPRARRASWSAARRSPRAHESTTSTSTSGATRRAAQYAHVTGYYSYVYGLGGGRVDPERDPVRQRPAAVRRRPGRRPGRQQQPKGGSVTLTIDPDGPAGGVRRTAGARATTARAPSSRSSRAPARSWRWCPTRPTTPTGWPPTTSTRGREDQASGCTRATPQPADQPRHRGDPTPGLDLQAGHRGGGARERASTTPRRMVPGRRRARPAADRAPTCVNDERRRVRRRPDHADPGAAGLVQRRLRRGRPRARRRRAARAGREVRVGHRTFTDLDDALTRQAVSRFPEDPDAPQTALSAIGQFDVAATPLQMAMVGGRHRQRRRGDAALPRRRGARARPRALDKHRPRADARPGDELRGLAVTCTQMMVDGRRRRHRHDRRRSRASRSPARPAPPRARRTVRRTPGSCPSPRRTTPRSRSRCSSRTPASSATRSPAAASPRRSPRPSWRR